MRLLSTSSMTMPRYALALEELFGTIGLATQCYRSAREFLDSDLTDLSSCIVIDIRQPDMNGLEFRLS